MPSGALDALRSIGRMEGSAIDDPAGAGAGAGAGRRGARAAATQATDFEALMAPFERELRAHCYRMLGSTHDADDALQETRVRAWRGQAGFAGGSLRAWLHRIAANVCLTEIERRGRRVLPIDLGPSGPADGAMDPRILDPIWLEPFPDDPEASVAERESVELAFVAALQHLPGNERAALILCEVLGFSAAEAAEALETTPAAINSALQRARRQIADRTPDQTQQATLRALGNDVLGKLVGRYADALASGDVDGLLELLSADASWSMPPMPRWFAGREEVTAFLLRGPLEQQWRHVPVHANRQLAVGCYMLVDDVFQAYSLDVLDLLPSGKIRSVTAFLDPAAFAPLGLPARLD